MSLRLYSTPQSAQAGEITFLAIVETTLAVIVTVWLALKYHTTTHIVMGTLLAPFLLLRTEASTKRGIYYISFCLVKIILLKGSITLARHMRNRARLLEQRKDSPYFLPYLLYNLLIMLLFLFPMFLVQIALESIFMTVALLLCSVAVKFIVTVQNLFLNPIHCISEIPRNWVRYAFSMDLLHPPELVPGIASSESMAYLSWEYFIRKMFQSDIVAEKSFASRAVSSFIMKITFGLFVFSFIPAWLYRISLKATSIIYLPLVWLVSDLNRGTDNAVTAMRIIFTAKYERLKFYYAVFVLMTTAIPIIIGYYYQKASTLLHGSKMAAYFFPVLEIDSWHITRLAGAIITVYVFFSADRILIQNATGDLSENSRNFMLISGLQRLRTLFTLWTIGCGIYILWPSIDWSTLPHVRFLPF